MSGGGGNKASFQHLRRTGVVVGGFELEQVGLGGVIDLAGVVDVLEQGCFLLRGQQQVELLPLTPRNSFTLWSTYRILPKLKVGGGATYVDKMYANATDTLGVPGYTRFDAMAPYTVNKRLQLQFNIYNLGDKFYYDKAYANYASVAPGRSAVLTAKLSF